LVIKRVKETPFLSGSPVFRSPEFKTFQLLPSDLIRPELEVMPLPPRRQEGPTVWQKRTQFPFLFVLTHDVCFSEVRQLLHTLCFQLISIVQNGCDDGHRCWFDYWLHFWLVEHYSVRVMKTREYGPRRPFPTEVVQVLVVPLQPCHNTCLVVLQHLASSLLSVQ